MPASNDVHVFAKHDDDTARHVALADSGRRGGTAKEASTPLTAAPLSHALMRALPMLPLLINALLLAQAAGIRQRAAEVGYDRARERGDCRAPFFQFHSPPRQLPCDISLTRHHLLIHLQAGMAQIRQLASLLTQQQQQVLPPFLSQLQSPAPRVAPSPSPSIHGATTSRLALSDEGGEAAGGVSGSVHHSMPHSSSSSIAAASSSAEDDAAATKLEGAETAGEECSAAQEPLTPTSLRTPLPQSPAVTDSDGDEAIKKGIENNVSGSSDDNGSDA
jgi:hypothetical protein